MNFRYLSQVVCSSEKILTRMQYYGIANVTDLALLSTIYEITSCAGTSIEYTCLKKLENLAQNLIIKNKDICHLRGEDVFLQQEQFRLMTILNNAPSVGNVSITTDELIYTFNPSQFQVNFSDDEGDLPDLVRIVSLPSSGVLKYNGEVISAGFLFNIEDAGNLTYTRVDNPYTVTFVFQTSDNNPITEFSNMANFQITVEGQINQPPTIGDGATTTPYSTTVVFTRAMFTSGTTPPYSDPEGDAALTLKITSLPATGNIKLSGVNINVNDEFDFTTDIDSGNLTYVPDPGVTTAHTPSFTFQIKDAGSGTFVS